MSRTFLGILSDLNNAYVWMVFTSPLISKSSSPFTNHLRIVTNAPITISITITFMFHIFLAFFTCLARASYLSLFLLSFIFHLSFFNITWSGLLAEIRWSVFITKSQRNVCISFSWIYSRLCIYHLLVWSIYLFLHSFALWLIASSLSPNCQYLLFRCVLSIFAST